MRFWSALSSRRFDRRGLPRLSGTGRTPFAGWKTRTPFALRGRGTEWCSHSGQQKRTRVSVLLETGGQECPRSDGRQRSGRCCCFARGPSSGIWRELRPVTSLVRRTSLSKPGRIAGMTRFPIIAVSGREFHPVFPDCHSKGGVVGRAVSPRVARDIIGGRVKSGPELRNEAPRSLHAGEIVAQGRLEKGREGTRPEKRHERAALQKRPADSHDERRHVPAVRRNAA